MRFRTRLVLAFAATALLPLLAIGIGVRRELTRRLTAQYDARAAALAGVTRETLARDAASVRDRLASLHTALGSDNRFRLVAVQGVVSERPYLLDWAGQAMRLTGLSMLQVQDESGRILSSGHFRNEYDRLEPDLPALLRAAPGGAALVEARTPGGPREMLAGVDFLYLGRRRFSIVGGIEVGPSFLRALTPDSDFTIALRLPPPPVAGAGATSMIPDTPEVGATVAPAASAAPPPDSPAPATGSRAAPSAPVARPPGVDRHVVATLAVPAIVARAGGVRALDSAQLLIVQSDAAFDALRSSVDRWFLATTVLAALLAAAAAAALAARLGRPLARLAEQTARVDLDHLDVAFEAGRPDEIGDLARLLRTMTRRLRTSAARLREAERRATVGDLARQVHHDVKNGLVPLRHVLRHLGEVERTHPEQLAAIFAERRPTLDASVEYLDALARNFARLTPRLAVVPCDLAAIIRDTVTVSGTQAPPPVAGGGAPAAAVVDVRVAADLPRALADPFAVRRILENLIGNALDALPPSGGRVTIVAERVPEGGVRVAVRDTGCGMSKAQLARAFDDFYTTKPQGTGLGLSIVRRLATDMGASVRVETRPEQGTEVSLTFRSESAERDGDHSRL